VKNAFFVVMQVEKGVQSDSELVQAVLAGDRRAYERLFERHERSVLAAALAVLGNYHAAQDVAQEAFVKAYRSLGGLRKKSSFGPWVRKIARREAIFSGEKVLQEAKSKGAKVTFWGC
jgi:predicted RNA polymerase sigma factor